MLLCSVYSILVYSAMGRPSADMKRPWVSFSDKRPRWGLEDVQETAREAAPAFNGMVGKDTF